MSGESRKVAYAGIAANLLIAGTKFAAAAWTGSSAMLSEGIHSIVDTANQGLLLYGLNRAARPADAEHPWGHGRELYFWSFVVALLIFALGAGFSAYEGVANLLDPEPIENPGVNYIVLAASAVFEGLSWRVAFRGFNASRRGRDFFDAVRRSKDPASFIVLFEDSAALIGIAIAAAGILLAQQLDMPVFDAIASLAIAALLAATAMFLAREAKSLLIGEPASAAVRDDLRRIAERQPGIDRVHDVATVHLGPDQVVSALSVDFSDAQSARDVERAVSALERRIRDAHPEIVALFVKPTSSAPQPASGARAMTHRADRA